MAYYWCSLTFDKVEHCMSEYTTMTITSPMGFGL